MLWTLVHGVNRVCAAKSAAGSWSSRSEPISAGGCASVGVSTRSNCCHARATSRVSRCSSASAAACSSAPTWRPWSRNQRVSGVSSGSAAGSSGMDAAPTVHKAMNAAQRSIPNGTGASSR